MFYIIFFIAWIAFFCTIGRRMIAEKTSEFCTIIVMGMVSFIWCTISLSILSAMDIYGTFSSFFWMLIMLLLTVGCIERLLQYMEKRNERYQKISDEANLKVEERLEAEERQKAEAVRKIDAMIKQYTPLLMKFGRTGVPLPISIDLVNKEVVDAVKKYKTDITEKYDRYRSTSNGLKTMLASEGCQPENAKYIFFIEKIKSLKREYDTMLGSKIMLLNEDSELMFELKLAFQYLQNSKKCVSNGVDVRTFISSIQPQGLSIFRYDNEPVTLFLGQHYFCLFSKVILVFDAVGVFVNAIDPFAMRIDVSRRETEVNICNGESSLNEHVDEDSKCIRRGEEKERWLYMCSDGSRDVKHIDNPWVRWRTDMYEYAVIKFTIAGESVSFEVSSDAVADAFDVFRYKYIRQHNHRKNFLPMFLQLMNRVSDGEDANIKNIIEICALQENENNRFCRIINC